MAITDFLDTKRAAPELRVALEVLREFKSGENDEEYLAIDFLAWNKLEQLEEFLEHLVEGKPLRDDTVRYRRRLGRGP